jgi:excisionase family DNA binding protein
MLLTVKALSQRLQIRPSTLYAWAAQGKIPCQKIHGLVRFEPSEIDRWLASFCSPPSTPTKMRTSKTDHSDLEQLIARAKRAVYTPACEKPDEVRAKQGG